MTVCGALSLSAFACGPSTTSVCPNDVPTLCPTPAPSYATAVAPALQRACLPCHGPGGAEFPTHDVTTYDTVFAQRRAMLNQIHACQMPPPGAPALTAAERTALLAWFVCEAPNN